MCTLVRYQSPAIVISKEFLYTEKKDGESMSLREFNQYIDMYLKENPLPDDAHFQELIQANLIKENESLSSFSLSTSDDNILVQLHPFVVSRYVGIHYHDYFELIYISRGRCTQTINGVSRDMKEGDLCLLTPNDHHAIATSHPSDLLFNIIIRPSLFEESFFSLIAENDVISRFFLTALFTQSAEQSYLYFPRHENTNLANHIQSLIKECFEKNLGYKKSMECYLALLFTELTRCHKDRIDKENYETMGNNQLSEILAYINLHKKDITLNAVAKKFHYHPKYLSALIKKYTNKSFSEFLQEAKLHEVCSYLRNTTLSIDEIIQIMGYYDRSYFNRLFKKNYHMTPSEYREKVKK